MRRGTLIAIIVLFVLLVVATVYQIRAAQGPHRYRGPVPGTPFPTSVTATP